MSRSSFRYTWDRSRSLLLGAGCPTGRDQRRCQQRPRAANSGLPHRAAQRILRRRHNPPNAPKQENDAPPGMVPAAQQILTSTLRATLNVACTRRDGRARTFARPMALSLNESTRSLGPRASRSPSHSLSLAPTATRSEKRPSAGLRSPAPTSPKQRSPSGRQIHQTTRSPKPLRTPSAEPRAKGAPSARSHGKEKRVDVTGGELARRPARSRDGANLVPGCHAGRPVDPPAPALDAVATVERILAGTSAETAYGALGGPVGLDPDRVVLDAPPSEV